MCPPEHPDVQRWRQYIDQYASGTAVDGQTDFVLAWIAEESCGSLCSTGIPGVEAGIFQLDTRAGADAQYASFAQLMGPCIRGARTPEDLTDEEMQIQIGSGLAKISDAVARAQAALDRAGVSWSGSDFGSLVKQVHALPCVLDLLSPLAAQGKAGNWDDFATAVLALPPAQTGGCVNYARPGSSHLGLQSRLADTLRNAAAAGAYWNEDVVGFVSSKPWISLALGAFVVWGLWELFGKRGSHAMAANPARRRRRRARARRYA